jgi:hypothetical protein
MKIVTACLIVSAVGYGFWALLGKLLPPEKEEDIFISLPKKKVAIKKSTEMKGKAIKKLTAPKKQKSKKTN